MDYLVLLSYLSPQLFFKMKHLRMASLVQIHKIFAKSYIFYELPIRMIL